jgi:hypothetical protein
MWNEAKYSIRGRVLDAASGCPLAGLHIRAYDRDLMWDDCLGTADTDARGDFRIQFFTQDFKEPLEGQPEIYIVVYGPDLNQLHFTEPVVADATNVQIEIRIPVVPRRTEARTPAFMRAMVPAAG